METYRDELRMACRFRKDRTATGGVTIWKDLRDEYHILMAKGAVGKDGEGNSVYAYMNNLKHIYEKRIEKNDRSTLLGKVVVSLQFSTIQLGETIRIKQRLARSPATKGGRILSMAHTGQKGGSRGVHTLKTDRKGVSSLD